MRLRAMLVCATVALALSASSSTVVSAHTEWKSCGKQRGQGAGWYKVRSSHVSCKDARAVARRYWNNGEGGEQHVKVDGVTYHCDDEQVEYEVSRVRCKGSGERKVRFMVGS